MCANPPDRQYAHAPATRNTTIAGIMVGSFSAGKPWADSVTAGGLAYALTQALKQFGPPQLTDLIVGSGGMGGGRGMGEIVPSSFYTPQVNQFNRMDRFILPAAVAGAIPAPMPTSAAGVGGLRTRRMGRR
jgi:hypothetical protein